MTSVIGSAATLDPKSLKSHYLIFDRIYCSFLTQSLLEVLQLPYKKEFAELMKNGFIKDPRELGIENFENKIDLPEVQALVDRSVLLAEKVDDRNKHIISKVDYTKFCLELDFIQSRLVSLYSSFHPSGNLVVPLVNTYESINISSLKYRTVLNCIIQRFPKIDLRTTWEQLREFKSDPDSKLKFAALRNWIIDVSKSQLNQTEVTQKIDYLLLEYENHMKLHRMKYEMGSIQVLITTTAEILGNIASFKWGKAASAIFTIRNQELQLLEAESKAPGREMAYISKAHKHFGGK